MNFLSLDSDIIETAEPVLIFIDICLSLRFTLTYRGSSLTVTFLVPWIVNNAYLFFSPGLYCSETCVFFAGKLGVGIVFLLRQTLTKWPVLLLFLHMASLYLHWSADWLALSQQSI